MKYNIYLMVILKMVCRIKDFQIFEYRLMILNVQIVLIMKKLISQLLIELWNLKLNSMV